MRTNEETSGLRRWSRRASSTRSTPASWAGAALVAARELHQEHTGELGRGGDRAELEVLGPEFDVRADRADQGDATAAAPVIDLMAAG
jgi:phage terminase large subunit-like protein